MESEILKDLVLVNGTDIWTEYGAFLVEERRGGMDNLTEILKASKVKSHVGVDFREMDGVKYADELDVKNEEREVALHFALVADTRAQWLTRYRRFVNMLKKGNNGWLEVAFTELGLTLKMFYVDCAQVKPLTYLWNEGVHAARLKVRFREPNPEF